MFIHEFYYLDFFLPDLSKKLNQIITSLQFCDLYKGFMCLKSLTFKVVLLVYKVQNRFKIFLYIMSHPDLSDPLGQGGFCPQSKLNMEQLSVFMQHKIICIKLLENCRSAATLCSFKTRKTCHFLIEYILKLLFNILYCNVTFTLLFDLLFYFRLFLSETLSKYISLHLLLTDVAFRFGLMTLSFMLSPLNCLVVEMCSTNKNSPVVHLVVMTQVIHHTALACVSSLVAVSGVMGVCSLPGS